MAEIISAGPFVTKGEERTAQELKKLPDEWIVICNKMLVADNGLDYELDFIVIADYYVYLLDEKSFQDPITGSDQIWNLADGSSQESPLNKASLAARRLATRLRRTVSPLNEEKSRFVIPGIVLSAAKQLPQIDGDSRVKHDVYLLSQVCSRLVQRDVREGEKEGRGPLIKQLRSRIRHSLYNLANRPETPAHINQTYTIMDATEVRPGVRRLNAKLIDWNEPRILLLYNVTRGPISRDELRAFYMREFKALQELRKTGFVPDVKDPFSWSDDFIVLPIVPPAGKALPAFPPPATTADLIHELSLAAHAFRALGVIHQQNVVHRAIKPEAIYVKQLTFPYSLTFTDFHAARMVEGTIATTLDEQEIEDHYIAPELSRGYWFARPHTDVFSLALIFLERWSGESLKTLRPKISESVALPNLHKNWSSLPNDGTARLNELFRAIFYPPSSTLRLRPIDVATQLEEMAEYLRSTNT